jgi:hypothetical protein
MLNPVHILNGDALKEQFPSTIPGEIIIFRECLSDGSVEGEFPDEFYRNRSQFIASSYEGYKLDDYFQNAVPELEKITKVESEKNVHLWFEVDLFCQVNMWFTIHTLLESGFKNSMYLVLPISDNEFGFGGMIESDLIVAFTEKQEISKRDQKKFQKLWEHYKARNKKGLISVSEKLEAEYPFLKETMKACLADMEESSHTKDSLRKIMEELGTQEFDPVFREFSKRESIYGYGDLQVKRLLDEIKS